MTEKPNPSSPRGDWPRDEQLYGGDNVRINSMFSIESTSRLGKRDKNQLPYDSNNDPEGDLMIMEGPTGSLSVSNKTIGGPPIEIIQQLDDDSAPLINLDSIQESERESDVSAATDKDNNISWLNINSTSTSSQGSQGSHAYQVPPLLGSYGFNNDSKQIHSNKTNSNNLTQPQKKQQTTEKPLKEQESHYIEKNDNNDIAAMTIPTPQNSNLDDVLGPNGEPMKSDLDDILGPQEDNNNDEGDGTENPSDLDDTLGPYEGSTIAGSTIAGSTIARELPVTSASTPVLKKNLDYNSEYVQFRDSDKKKGEENKDSVETKKMSKQHNRPTPLQMDDPDSNHQMESLVPLPNDMVGYCAPAETPKENASTTSPRITPSASRRAIDNIGEALQGRTDVDNYAWSPREAAILPEAFSDGMSTAFDTAVESTIEADQLSPSMASITEKMTTAASISGNNHNRPLIQPSIVQQQQQYHRQSGLMMNNFAESSSTWESRATGISHTTKSSAYTKSFTSVSSNGEDTTTQDGDETTLGVDTNQSSQWDSSRADTFSPNSSNASYSRYTQTFSSSRRDTFSPRADSILSPTNSSATFSPGDSSSRRTSSHFSQTDSSQFSQTDHSRDDQFSPTEHSSSQFSPTEHTCSDFSPTEHSQFSPTDHNGTQFTFSSQSKLSNTTSVEEKVTERATERGSLSRKVGAATALASVSKDEPDDDDGSKGGRMWQAAQLQANSSKNRPLSPRAKKFADSIMARTRSCADPDALLNNVSNVDGMEKPTRSMLRISTREEDGFIESTAIAKKRGRTVQLLTIALLSFLIAFLGGFWVLSSCHFVSVAVQVGENEEAFDLRFGLWKYSPIDSAFQGYSYCSYYDGDFVADAPWFGRISSLVALAGGAFSLGVLWLYLVIGQCVQNIWAIAVFAAAVSGILQLSTLSIFAGPICSQEVCTLGPAGIISVVAGCFYFVLAFEMHYNTPLVKLDDRVSEITSPEHPHHLMANLEMTDFEYGAKAYVHRIAFGDANPYPSLNQGQQRSHHPVSKTTRDRSKIKNGSYVPPTAFV
eukprot:CAMPEP_0170818988 /NCGR_PEP_ID=MMETSP0733-20121128/41132_1 /TAXON_ID=186038 /ORGANISM="Fragilariopsis kerguelensis, Strain L26-C5" /LENGTH=1049 /DNA_ID=CAMNT_0011179343 /DNA_START=51 /DNA_END=3200 /DNA_ORIENTATION=+